MRRYSAVFKLAIGLLTATFCAPSTASTLYQWTGKDGTPTYSPDPPPAGVSYELVGADLKPLPKNVDKSKPVTAKSPSPATTNSAPGSSVALATAQTPNQQVIPQPVQKPVAPWKPVRYANDPTPRAKKPTKTAEPTVDPVTAARNSPECRQARQQMVLLEGQFAQALTDKQMDSAVLRLSEHKSALQSACTPD